MKDFFAQQEQARRNTSMLVFLFACAVVLIIFSVYCAATAGLYLSQMFAAGQSSWFVRGFWDGERFLWIVGLTIAVVAFGSLYRTYQLKQGGGAAVADMLGAERVASATDDPLLRRLLNIVEEMAIASGLPAPPVYLMQQSGINAFAAGFGRTDAVIAVTSGATGLLARDELQGVIAHEFSHILNGDTSLKMQLMGLLYGITLISDAGILMMTARGSARYSRTERGSHPAVIVTGFMIFMAGTIGAVFADMIKRAVSRQREFLADAAAVQFTRNPSGLANALKTIGGFRGGSHIAHASTRQVSHFFFSNAAKPRKSMDWWAAHPPLAERIRRLEPGFRGVFEPVDSARRSALVADEAVAALADAWTPQPTAALEDVNSVINSIGHPDFEGLQQARALIAMIPERLSRFSRDPYTARAVMYALLIDQRSIIRKRQMELLQKQADANVFREMLDILSDVSKLARALRLPLLEMMLPALKSLSHAQFLAFRACIRALIQADRRVDIFEYMLQRMLLRHLYPVFTPVRRLVVQYHAAGEIVDAAACIIAIMIRAGTHNRPEEDYRSAMNMFTGELLPAMPDREECALSGLDEALKKAERASPALKRKLLAACVSATLSDGKAAAREIELLRAIADSLDCPMPQFGLTSLALPAGAYEGDSCGA
jgi:Zn-dependent protease with chaperone function